MKKLLLVVPIFALLAAGCSSSQQVNNQTPTPTAVTQSPTPTPISWKDSVLAEFSSLTDWEQSTPADWQLADHSNDAEHLTQLKKYGTGKILLLSKTFNENGCKSDCSIEGKAQSDLIAGIKNSLSKNGWSSVSWANEPSAYTDYLYIKDNHPIILQVGTRNAVTGGLYVNLEFQY